MLTAGPRRCILLDAGKLSDYLSTVKKWLDGNANEVVTILMVNSDNVDASVFAKAYQTAGLDSYAYTPPSTPIAYDSWPTLQELIDSGKRAVNFLASGADMSSAPYLLDEFTHIWETPFNVSREYSVLLKISMLRLSRDDSCSKSTTLSLVRSTE